MVKAIEVHPSIQLQYFHTLRQLPTWMCLQNNIALTSSDAYIYHNIYLFIVVITHIIHIHSPSNWLVLKITCCCLRQWQTKNSKSLLHLRRFLLNAKIEPTFLKVHEITIPMTYRMC